MSVLTAVRYLSPRLALPALVALFVFGWLLASSPPAVEAQNMAVPDGPTLVAPHVAVTYSCQFPWHGSGDAGQVRGDLFTYLGPWVFGPDAVTTVSIAWPRQGTFTVDCYSHLAGQNVGSITVTVRDPVISITGGTAIGEGETATFAISSQPPPGTNLDVTVSVAQSQPLGITTGNRTVTVPTTGLVQLQLATTDTPTSSGGTITVTILAGAGYTVSGASGSASVIVQPPWAEEVPPNTVRLVSVTSYTLDIEELNRLEIERARAEFPLPRAAVFSCVSSDGMSVMVSDTAATDDTTGIYAWKLPKENETPLQALGLGIRSDKIRDMSCQARIWDQTTTAGDHDLETNAVKLRWQQKGRTIFRKEEAFRGTPGGTATWLFIPPVFLGLVFAGATRNAAGTLLVVAVSLGIAVWFTESPPVLWVVVVATAAAGVLLFIQFGFRGR